MKLRFNEEHLSRCVSRLAGVRAIAAVISFAAVSCLGAQVPGYTITTVAGGGRSSGSTGPATSAVLTYPCGIAVDASGNLYIADNALLSGVLTPAIGPMSGVIHKVSPSGAISIVAGGGPANEFLGDGGPATSATLSFPTDVAVDAAGNLYIADTGDQRIRKVSTNGTITTVAGPGSTNGALGDGGPATSATLSSPQWLAIDSVGNLYIADAGHNRIRKVSLDGTITTVAGPGPANGALGDGGPATGATLNTPQGVAVDAAGNLYIAEYGLNRIRKVSPSGIITTVAGNGGAAYFNDGGLATVAAINEPEGIAVDATGDIYIADYRNNRLRVVTTDGEINTIAGNGGGSLTGDGGPATGAGISLPLGVALGSGGKVYVLQSGDITLLGDPNRVRLLTPAAKPVFPTPLIAAVGQFSVGGFGQFSQLALGSWVSIYGSYLAPDSRSWAAADFNGVNAPTSLDGTSMTIGGQPAFIGYISPGQIDAQVPTNVGMGAQPLIVTTSAGKSATFAVTVNPSEPGLLAPPSFEIGSTPYVVALFPDGATLVLPSGAIAGVPSRPATAGDNITMYGVGFGSVAPNIPAGQIVQGSNALALPFLVYFGSTEATVTYAGLAPGSVGLYQFNVTVPKLSTIGAVPLNFTLGGVAGTQQLFISTQ
jgi:uncharacterized protein (TIGR03437 family)